MQLKEAIKNRRSIRSYKKKSVSEKDILEILQAGIDAPSAGNLHSRFFYVVGDSKLRAQLSTMAYDQTFIKEAPVALVVCTDTRIKKEYGKRGVDVYTIMDCSASIQNMILTAYSLGLGTCWVGAFNEKQVSRLLECPTYLKPVAIVPVGYPAEKPAPPPKVSPEAVCKFC